MTLTARRPRRPAALADTAERVPVIGALVSFYRYIQLNLPRSTTAGGVVMLWGIAAIHVYWLVRSGDSTWPVPSYLRVYFALEAACSLIAGFALPAGRIRAVTRIGWGLGSLAGGAAMAMYLVSRTAGLPGLPLAVGRWDYPLGTFTIALAGVYLITHVAVLTGLAIAVPDRRSWHD